MQIDITRFFNEAGMIDYSASRAELGQDAARITWANAMNSAGEYSLLDSDDAREAFRDHMRGYGAWEDDEIDAWNDQHCNALMLQLIAGDVREAESATGMSPDIEDDEFWRAYEKASVARRVGGRMSRGDDGQVYYYLGD